MRKLCLVLLVLALPSLGHATVLTFGPFCSSGTCGPLGTYGGFIWSSDMYAEANDLYMSGYGNTYGAPSGAGAFNGFGDDGTSVSSASPFLFNGADFTSWAGNDSYQGYSSTTITIDAYDSLSNFLGSCGATLSPSSYNFLSCNIANVSTLVFHNDIGTSGHWWLMDDFTYNATTTPEPGTLILLGSSVLGIFGTLRRKLVR